MRYTVPALNAKGGTDVAIEELVLSVEDLADRVARADDARDHASPSTAACPASTATRPCPAGRTPVRLDVAAFVGFAERGPVDACRCRVVEDTSQYRAVFGGDSCWPATGRSRCTRTSPVR